MRRLLIAIIFTLTQLVTSSSAQSTELGLLILEIGFNRNSDSSAREFNVMNIENKKYVVHHDPIHHPMVAEVEEGIYCVYSLKYSDNTDFEYCGEPYFKVLGGKINNAGFWKFKLDRTTWSVDSAFQNLAETLAHAKSYDATDAALIEKYSHAVP